MGQRCSGGGECCIQFETISDLVLKPHIGSVWWRHEVQQGCSSRRFVNSRHAHARFAGGYIVPVSITVSGVKPIATGTTAATKRHDVSDVKRVVKGRPGEYEEARASKFAPGPQSFEHGLVGSVSLHLAKSQVWRESSFSAG